MLRKPRAVSIGSRPLAHAAAPAVLMGMVLGLSAISAPQAKAISFVTNRDALNATDQVNWSTLGPLFSPLGPPDPAAFLPNLFTTTSQAGKSVQVDIPKSDTPGLLPPFVFQTAPEPEIATNFKNGDFILFTGVVLGPPPPVGNPGPLTLTFADPVFGAGAQLAAGGVFDFTGTISAFDRDDQLLGSFSAAGTSSLALDNSALFFGVIDGQPRISKLEFKSSIPNGPFGINQLSLVTDLIPDKTAVPEPSSLIALGVIAAFGGQHRRKYGGQSTFK